MASNTPNLNLLKKDPVADGNDTFNIQTMLNENWDKIDAAVGEVREELGDIDFPLSDATNGTRSDVAASEKAVGQVMSAAQAAQTTANAANLAATAAQTKADQAFQSGNERKAEVVAALVAKGISATTSESWDSLIAKMAAIIKATGNATAADVLAPKTASNANGPFVGTMPDQGSKSATLTMQGQQYTILAGKHDGTGKITASFANLVAGNVRSGVNIGGVIGTVNPKTQGEAIVNISTTRPAPIGSTLSDVITFPTGVNLASFKSTYNAASSLNYMSNLTHGSLRFTTGERYTNKFVDTTGAGYLYISYLVIDFKKGFIIIYDDVNKKVKFEGIPTDFNTNPVKLSLVANNNSSVPVDTQYGALTGTFHYE